MLPVLILLVRVLLIMIDALLFLQMVHLFTVGMDDLRLQGDRVRLSL